MQIPIWEAVYVLKLIFCGYPTIQSIGYDGNSTAEKLQPCKLIDGRIPKTN